MQLIEINSLVLAYIGDAVFELLVRDCLINKSINNVNTLQKEALNYVSAKSQASFLKKMLNDKFLNEEELDIVKRARNAKCHSHPKNCDIVTYKYATALEALFGYLYKQKNNARIEELFEEVLKC